MPKKDKKKTAAHKERVAQKVHVFKTMLDDDRQHPNSPRRRPKAARSVAATTTARMKIWTSTAS